MPVPAARRHLRNFLCDVQPGNGRSHRDVFESEVRGIIRTDRELGAGFRNDLRFAQHEFGDTFIVAPIECRHPLAKGDAAERHLRMHVLAHEILRVRGNFAIAQRRALGAARHDADMFGFGGQMRRLQMAAPFCAQLSPRSRNIDRSFQKIGNTGVCTSASNLDTPNWRLVAPGATSEELPNPGDAPPDTALFTYVIGVFDSFPRYLKSCCPRSSRSTICGSRPPMLLPFTGVAHVDPI